MTTRDRYRRNSIMLSPDENVQVPYHCGENDCPVGWHITLYSLDPTDLTPISGDTDGNWEGCSRAEVPTWKEHDAAWQEYDEHVARTGEDPLGNFSVKRETVRQVRWQFEARNSILGVALTRARPGGRGPWLQARDLPAYVRDYFNLPESGVPVLQDFKGKDLAALKTLAVDVTWQRSSRYVAKGLTTPLTQKTPRAPHLVATDLRAAAARALATKKETP